MRIVVTGSSGLIGHHAVADLRAHGHDVVALDCVPAAQSHAQDLADPATHCLALDLTDPAALPRLDALLIGADALIHLARMRFPYTGRGLAANGWTWDKPDCLGDAARLASNLQMSCHLMAAVANQRVPRVVIGSSLAIYGFYYPSHPWQPGHFPVDELHPLAPDDPYGLSKLLAEQLASGLAASTATQVASLRFPGVAGADHEQFRRAQDVSIRGLGALGAYIDARDAARACRLAIETNLEGHQSFNVCAPNTLLAEPTRDWIARHFPQYPGSEALAPGDWPGYDSGKANRLLGFQAQYVIA